MTPSRPTNARIEMVVGLCAVALILAPVVSTPVLAAPIAIPATRPAGVFSRGTNLAIDRATATRVLAETEGAAQEADPDQPRPMDEQAVTGPKAPAGKVKKEAAPPPAPSHFAFLKDWPFWVIVGGVVVAGVVGIVLLRNSNQEGPCAVQFNSMCFGTR